MRSKSGVKFLILLGIACVSFSCQKHEKEPRPLNVTQKILKAKQGQFQSLMGDLIKFENGNKLVFVKRFMSRQLISIAEYAASATRPVDYTNSFCSVTREYNVEMISLPDPNAVSDRYPHLNSDKRIDRSIPVYVFQMSLGNSKISIFKDEAFGNESDSTKDNLSICEREEPYFPHNSGAYFVQYPDENSMVSSFPHRQLARSKITSKYHQNYLLLLHTASQKT